VIIGREELEYARTEAARDPREYYVYSPETDMYSRTSNPAETDQVIFDPYQILDVCKHLTIEEENEILQAAALLKILKEISQ